MVSRLLAVCAVAAEADALLAGLAGAAGPAEPANRSLAGPTNLTGRTLRLAEAAARLDTVVSGVGPAAAAAATAAALATGAAEGHPYDVVLSAGIAGGFRGSAATIGGVVVGDRLVYADLGVITRDGFLDVATLGFGAALGSYTPPPGLVATLADKCRLAGLPTAVGTVLTLSSFTGTDERAAHLQAAHAPAAEAMEGVGVATAAAVFGVPAVEIRTISNAVGDRDREAWELPGALAALTRAGQAVFGAPWEV